MLFFQIQNKQDVPQEIDVDTGMIFEKLDSWVDGFIKLLPNIGIAIVLIIIFYFLARFLGNVVGKISSKRDRDNLGSMLGGLVKYAVLGLGIMLGITIVVPSVTPSSIIAGLGVSSVAIGFAFKDILQNWLAGLLILIRQPFEIDDQIEVSGYEGTVEKIETRATILNTYAGERIVIPNNQIYTSSVKVKTAHELRRSQFDVGIGYGDSIGEATEVLEKALDNIEGIVQDKGIEVFPWELAESWVTLRVRWWTKSDRGSVVKTKARVIGIIKQQLDDAKIDMPYDTKVHLIHDQTESTDGDRNKQREGWPSQKEGENPKPKWKAEKEEGTKE